MRTPVLVNRIEAAAILGVSPRTFTRIRNRNPWNLPIYKIVNRQKLYRKTAVLELKKSIAKQEKVKAKATPIPATVPDIYETYDLGF